MHFFAFSAFPKLCSMKHCIERFYLIYYKRKEIDKGKGERERGRKKKGKESSILEFHSGDLQCPGHTKGSALRSKFISITPTNS